MLDAVYCFYPAAALEYPWAAVVQHCRLASAICLDDREEIVEADRLMQHVGHGHRASPLCGADVGSQYHNGDRTQPGIGLLLGQELKTVHDRHHDIQQN